MLFDAIPRQARHGKPRTTGLTFVIDWGIGPRQQQDLLDVGADFFDLAKIAVGIAGLLRADVVRQKIDAYRAGDVEAFPGGQYLEHAHVHGADDAYLPAAVEAGFRWIEVSDNMADVSLDWKSRMIRAAVEQHQLHVLGEVGRKEGKAANAAFVDDARACRDAGAAIILLEAAELISEDAAVQRSVDEVVEAVGLEVVMFELPGPWIEGVRACDIHAMRRRLLARFGAEVNIGNCAPEDLVTLEALRVGLGVNAGGD